MNNTRRPLTQDLAARYGGRIRANVAGNTAVDMLAIASELMGEWNPISAAAEELTAIMGPPTQRKGDVLWYSFDSGMGGGAWCFTLMGDVVVGVRFVPFE
jgi:hypothetical protein